MKLTYKGKTFGQRDGDGFVNLTQMCRNFELKFNDWIRLDKSYLYLLATAEALNSPDAGNPVSDNHAGFSPLEVGEKFGLLISETNAIGGKGDTWGLV